MCQQISLTGPYYSQTSPKRSPSGISTVTTKIKPIMWQKLTLRAKTDYSIYNNRDRYTLKLLDVLRSSCLNNKFLQSFIRECVFTIQHIISNFKILLNLKKEIQLWLSNLVKQVIDFAQCQQEFFVIKNMPFSDFYVTEVNYNKISYLGNPNSERLCLIEVAVE